MTERQGDGSASAMPDPSPRSAGALLKAAREREGLHIAVLAATIKVSPAKLDALEKDRYDELPNATFTRALAQSVCRSLKIDPRPVLALLPQQDTPPLESAVGKLNAPFQERSSRSDVAGLAWTSKPMFWAGGLLLAAAIVLALVPRDWIDGRGEPLPAASAAASAPAVDAPSLASAAATAVSRAGAAAVQAAASLASAALPVLPAAPNAASAAPAAPLVAGVAAPAPAMAASANALPAERARAAGSAPAVASAVRAGILQISAAAASWVEVLDAEGQSLLSRVIQPGERVAIDGRRPLRVKVGNVAGTRLEFRGAPVDLAPHARDNVARIELR